MAYLFVKKSEYCQEDIAVNGVKMWPLRLNADYLIPQSAETNCLLMCMNNFITIDYIF